MWPFLQVRFPDLIVTCKKLVELHAWICREFVSHLVAIESNFHVLTMVFKKYVPDA